MATVTQPQSHRSQPHHPQFPSPPPVPAAKFIDSQVQKTREQVKTVEVWSELLSLGVLVMAFLLTVVILDHWVFASGLGLWGRALAFASLIGGIGWYLWAKVLPLVVQRINPVYAAATIEKSEPRLKNSLINFLMLRSSEGTLHPGIADAIEQRAAGDLSRVPLEQVIDYNRLLKVLYVLVALVAAGCLYTILSPKNSLASLQRVILPWASVSAPTRVSISDVQPGNGKVFTGEFQEISALVEGLAADEQVTLYYTTADNTVVEQPVEMQLPENSTRYKAILPSDGEGLGQDAEYYLVAGDVQTEVFRLQVRPPPSITVESVEYRYPAYTKLSPHMASHGGIQALEGTEVTINATANQPIRENSAQLQFLGEGNYSPINLRGQGQAVSGSFTLSRNAGYSKYLVRFQTPEGQLNPFPVRHAIEVLEDQAPEVSIADPGRDNIELPADQTLTLTVEALDPDFALTSLQVHFVVEGRDLLVGDAGELLQEPVEGPHEGRYFFRPQQFQLTPGTTVTYYAEAADNRPTPNRSRSRQWTLTIVEPQPRPDQNQPEQGQGQAEPRQGGQGGRPPEEQQPADQPQDGQPQDGQPQDGQPQNGQPQDGQPGQAGDQAGQQGQESQQPQKPRNNKELFEEVLKHLKEKQSQQEGKQEQPNQQGDQPEGSEQPQRQAQPERQAQSEESEPQGSDDSQQENSAGKQNDNKANTPNQSNQPQDGTQDASQRQPDQPNNTGQQNNPGQTNGQGTEPQGNQQNSGSESGAPPNNGQQNNTQPNNTQPNNTQPNEGQSGQPPNGQSGESQQGSGSKTRRDQPGGMNDPNSASSTNQNPNRQQPGQQQPGQQQPGQQQSGQPPTPGQDSKESGADSSKPSEGGGDPQVPEGAQPQDGGTPQGSPPQGDQPNGMPPEGMQGGGDPTSEKPNQPQPGMGDSPVGSPKENQGTPSGREDPDATGGSRENPDTGSGQGRPSEDSKPTPEAQGANQDRSKQPGPGDRKDTRRSIGEDPSSPSNDEKKSDGQTESDDKGDKSGGGAEGGGEDANREGTGGAGQNTGSQTGGQKTRGPGQELDSKAGNDALSDRPTGRSDPRKTPGNGSKEGPAQSPKNGQPGGQQVGKQQPSQEPTQQADQQPGRQQTRPPQQQPSQQQQGQQQQPQQRPAQEDLGRGGTPDPNNQRAADQQSGGVNPTEGGGRPAGQRDDPTGNPRGQENLAEYGSDAVDPSDSNRQVDLVFKHLEEELAKEDSDLVDRLGGNREELKDFLNEFGQYFEEAKKAEPGSKQRQKWERLVDGLGIGSKSRKLSDRPARSDNQRGNRAGFRIPPPAEYQSQFEAYKKSLPRSTGE